MEKIILILNILILAALALFYLKNNKKHKILYSNLETIKKNQQNDFRQLQLIINLNKLLDINCVLPEIRTKWSIYPDLAVLIIERIKFQKPKIVMELGSGSSSIIIGYWLKKLNYGRLISLEHDEVYYNKTKQLLELHELTDYVDLIFAPFKEITIKNFKGNWYDISALDEENNIELLIVDGPPGFMQKNARYPALPILFPKLAGNSVIIADDCNRYDEQEIIQMWKNEFKFRYFEKIETETGTVILQLEK